jgi:hypothetical protein
MNSSTTEGEAGAAVSLFTQFCNRIYRTSQKKKASSIKPPILGQNFVELPNLREYPETNDNKPNADSRKKRLRLLAAVLFTARWRIM